MLIKIDENLSLYKNLIIFAPSIANSEKIKNS
jgi:hypothetical protein